METRDWIAARSASPAILVSLILWIFGFTLVTILAGLMGRGFLVQFLIQLPLCVAALCLAGALYILWQRLDAHPLAIRLPSIALACVAAGAVQSALDLGLYQWLTDTRFPEWRNWATIDLRRIGFVYILYTWTFCLNVTLFWALGLGERARMQARLAAAAEARAQDAKIDALRFQLNPHFLLNALNAISSLIVQDRAQDADLMTMKLAGFLHMNLASDVKAPISLAEEIATIQSYLDMENIRFGDRLRVDIDCPDALLDAAVPAFILQPLVENAVKYAVAPSRSGAMIQVVAQTAGQFLTITVADDGCPGAEVPVRGTGVGLQNIRSRLAALYGAGGELITKSTERGFTAALRMPLVRLRQDS